MQEKKNAIDMKEKAQNGHWRETKGLETPIDVQKAESVIYLKQQSSKRPLT